MPTLFDPIEVGKLTLANRIVMAPMTRNRAGEGGVPTALAAEYYAQRASAGLLITEGTQPSPVGQGYVDTPGMHSDEQVEGWHAVADAVHAAGGHIFVQLMHAGRVGHPDNKTTPQLVAPSAIAAPGEIFTPGGMKPQPVPRGLEAREIPEVVGDFVRAAERAAAAGLDGVEIHAANGYLVHQFLAPSTNRRADGYGGTPRNRARFAGEIVHAVADAIGPEKVGIRISPSHNIQGVIEDDAAETAATYRALTEAIAPLDIAYLSYLADPRSELIRDLTARFGGVTIANGGFAEVTSLAWAEAVISEGLADLVAVGRPLLANPDLVARWHTGTALNEFDPGTFYGGGAGGYTDYPAAG
ncbi:alkene reductase [Actinacidiphila sp. ITFR-21]|uniref:alkene reductase n=1 Tax=Actinacidiphila sp. ITFR-21 TaxID=3075199 RepID=UPI00288BF8FE|nr:alkene reductase [Streptomyces sp. ITFR-21]WNI18466.1 alkene reductase [Streptomyces sp. ITFR-21]